MNKSFPCKVFFNKENSNVFRLPEPFSHIWSFWFNLQWAWKNYKKKHKLRPDFLFDWISPILFKFIFITLNVCFPDCKLSYLSHASKLLSDELKNWSFILNTTESTLLILSHSESLHSELKLFSPNCNNLRI